MLRRANETRQREDDRPTSQHQQGDRNQDQEMAQREFACRLDGRARGLAGPSRNSADRLGLR